MRTRWAAALMTAAALVATAPGAMAVGAAGPASVATSALVAQETSTVSVTAATAGARPIGVVSNVWGTVSGASDANVQSQVLVDGTWRTSQTSTTDAKGFYAIPLTYGANSPGTYTFRVVATVDGSHHVSPTVTLTRTGPKVDLTASTAGARPVNTHSNVWGTATGAPNAPIQSQVLVNGSWMTSQTSTTNSSGGYAIPLTYGANTPGTYTFRVVTTVSGQHFVSSTVTLTRTPITVTAVTAGSRPLNAPTNIWGSAEGAPHAEVNIWARIDGAWRLRHGTMTDANGGYVTPLMILQDVVGPSEFRVIVRHEGRDYHSPVVTLTRTDTVSVTAATAGWKELGAPSFMWGRATGAAHATVAAQTLVRGEWRTSQTTTTDANGYYTLPLTYGSTSVGQYPFRAVVTAPGGPHYSPTVTLNRLAPSSLPRCPTGVASSQCAPSTAPPPPGTTCTNGETRFQPEPFVARGAIMLCRSGGFVTQRHYEW